MSNDSHKIGGLAQPSVGWPTPAEGPARVPAVDSRPDVAQVQDVSVRVRHTGNGHTHDVKPAPGVLPARRLSPELAKMLRVFLGISGEPRPGSALGSPPAGPAAVPGAVFAVSEIKNQGTLEGKAYWDKFLTGAYGDAYSALDARGKQDFLTAFFITNGFVSVVAEMDGDPTARMEQDPARVDAAMKRAAGLAANPAALGRIVIPGASHMQAVYLLTSGQVLPEELKGDLGAQLGKLLEPEARQQLALIDKGKQARPLWQRLADGASHIAREARATTISMAFGRTFVDKFETTVLERLAVQEKSAKWAELRAAVARMYAGEPPVAAEQRLVAASPAPFAVSAPPVAQRAGAQLSPVGVGLAASASTVMSAEAPRVGAVTTKEVAASPAAQAVLPPLTGQAATAKWTEVTVRSGDSLGKLALRHGLSLAQLKELNPELWTPPRSPNLIRADEDKIRLPVVVGPGFPYLKVVVQPGDTVTRIGERYEVAYTDLREANPEYWQEPRRPDVLVSGQDVFKIPVAATGAMVAVDPTQADSATGWFNGLLALGGATDLGVAEQMAVAGSAGYWDFESTPSFEQKRFNQKIAEILAQQSGEALPVTLSLPEPSTTGKPLLETMAAALAGETPEGLSIEKKKAAKDAEKVQEEMKTGQRREARQGGELDAAAKVAKREAVEERRAANEADALADDPGVRAGNAPRKKPAPRPN